MADFCAQCTAIVLGMDPTENDFVNIGKADPDAEIFLTPDEAWAVLCEGCGPTLVDEEGNCLVDNCTGGILHSPGNKER